MSRGELQPVGRRQGFAFQSLPQSRFGVVVADVSRAVDIAVADPVLQRNAPHPPAGLCRGAGERGDVVGIFRRTGQSHRAVARQPVAPVAVRRANGLLDQQAAKARAVDKQVALDPPAIVEAQGGDIAAFGILID
ncbi:hypothetical protein ABAC460_14490 [Asticcacaulis sp. AC460]|nr:hypothetical protein ABAC460_14490 [Asticcacaulis sp. AC460]